MLPAARNIITQLTGDAVTFNMNPYGARLFTVTIVLYILAKTMVALRMISRRMIHQVGNDDYAIVVASVSLPFYVFVVNAFHWENER